MSAARCLLPLRLPLLALAAAALLCALSVAPFAAAQTCAPDALGQCRNGFGCCKSYFGGFACRDLAKDADHCTGCNRKCGSGGYLGGPTARSCCPAGAFSQCVDVLTNAQNCGACGKQCTEGKICVSGSCQCAPGSILHLGGCAPCAPGTFTALPNAQTCLPCPKNTFAPGYGATECTACRAGSRSSGATGLCEPVCPANTRTVETAAGELICEKCPVGTVSAEGSLECRQCNQPNEYYVPAIPGVTTTQVGEVTSWPRETTASETPASCALCPPNKRVNAAKNGCESCPFNLVSIEGVCKCPEGTFGDGSATCQACNGVNAYSHAGDSACRSCKAPLVPAGDHGSCVECPAGQSGVSGVCKCAAGSIGTAGLAPCTPCNGARQYSSGPGATSCSTCADPLVPNASRTGCVRCANDADAVSGVCGPNPVVPRLENAGFESSIQPTSVVGWSKAERVGSGGDFWVLTCADTSPLTYQYPRPTQADKAVGSDSPLAKGSYLLYQRFTVPAAATAVRVRFDLFWKNLNRCWTTGSLNDLDGERQQARIDILKPQHAPEKLWSIAAGDVAATLWQTVEGTTPSNSNKQFKLINKVVDLSAWAGQELVFRIALSYNQAPLFLAIDNIRFDPALPRLADPGFELSTAGGSLSGAWNSGVSAGTGTADLYVFTDVVRPPFVSPAAVPQGLNALTTDQDTSAAYFLGQAFVVPGGIQSVVLKASVYWNNGHSDWVTDGPIDTYGGAATQTARIDVLKQGVNGLTITPADIVVTLWQPTAAVTPLTSGGAWVTVSATIDLAPFAGQTLTFRFVQANNQNALKFAIDDIKFQLPS